jgi:hypothetical protein
VNETTTQAGTATGTATTAAALPIADPGLAARQLQHVGAAYGFIFLLLFAFAWRTSAATKRLGERLDEIERDQRPAR